jgi:hypothetical protein
VILELGPLGLVIIIEELLERKSSSTGLENRDQGRRGSSALTARHPFLSTKTNIGTNFADKGRRTVCIVRSQTQATDFVFVLFVLSEPSVGGLRKSARNRAWFLNNTV